MKNKSYFSQRSAFRIWIIILFILPILILYPIGYRLIKLAIVILSLGVWLGGIYFFRKNKLIQISYISLGVGTLIFLLLPGWQVSGDNFRKVYAQELTRYEGTNYVWGGESKIGIDCSGLVRQGLIHADIKQGLITLNSALIRNGISLWWYDTSAAALRDEYRNYTKRIAQADSINKIDYNQIKIGDLAATADGVHILAYLGDRTWIEADPSIHKVIKVKIPEPDNIWFNMPVYILEWQQFSQ